MRKIRKKNPSNWDLLNQLIIEKKSVPKLFGSFRKYYIYLVLFPANNLAQDFEGNDWIYDYTDPEDTDMVIGIAVYDPSTKTIDQVRIDKNYQRQGISSFLYNYIEKDQNIRLKPSKTLLSDGKEFWKTRLKKEKV